MRSISARGASRSGSCFPLARRRISRTRSSDSTRSATNRAWTGTPARSASSTLLRPATTSQGVTARLAGATPGPGASPSCGGRLLGRGLGPTSGRVTCAHLSGRRRTLATQRFSALTARARRRRPSSSPPSVVRHGAASCRPSGTTLKSPSRALRRVLHEDARGLEGIANCVSSCIVAALPGSDSLVERHGNQCVDRRPEPIVDSLAPLPVQRIDAQEPGHGPDVGQRSTYGLVRTRLSQRCVPRAHRFVDHGQGTGGAEVLVHARSEGVWDPWACGDRTDAARSRGRRSPRCAGTPSPPR